MSEKISLTQQDEPSMSAEIFAWLRQSGSRHSPAAATPPAPAKTAWGCFPPAGHLRAPGDRGIGDAGSPRASCGQGCSH